MCRVLSICKRIADSDGTVLLTGESGTGKEICATYIYENSRRAGDAFLPINCSAIPSELVEAELFGYEKGAFTGADSKGRMGMLEVADHGTVFLDEIGELPLHVQPKLLRFLETGEIKRVGGSRLSYSDVRVIAATNRDLRQLVAQHKFREDLFYRLNVLPVHIPPLRNRREDILPLASFFLQQFNRKYERSLRLSPQFQEKLLAYHWPGNIRELQHTIEKAVILAEKNVIRASDLFIRPGKALSFSEVPNLEEVERQAILAAITQNEGNLTAAAEQLGVSRQTLYNKMKRFNL